VRRRKKGVAGYMGRGVMYKEREYEEEVERGGTN
jgi:hypothetical protein